MKKKIRTVVITILMVVLGAVILKFNIYDTQFYSVFFWLGDIHTPLELEKVTYVSHRSSFVEGEYVFDEEDELEIWDDFVTWLNDTTMIRIRTTKGFSYTGEKIYFKFKGIEEEFWIVVSDEGESFKMDDYKWKPKEGEVVLPIDAAYLQKMKKEQKIEE